MLILLVALSAAVGLAASIYSYIDQASGIDGTEGALLVIISSALIAGAALAIGLTDMPSVLRLILEVLIVLGILGTMAAAYLLMSWILLGTMVAAIVFDILRPVAGRRQRAFA